MILSNIKESISKYFKKRPLKEIGLFLLDILYNAVIIIFLVILIRSFIISPFRVIGSSMINTLSNNEFILIDRLSYYLREPKRGDAIVFLPPITNKQLHKFERTIYTDKDGVGVLDISNLRTDKQIFYCQNQLIKKIWLCKDKVRENDLIFYKIYDEKNSKNNTKWEQADKKIQTSGEIEQKKIVIQGNPNKNYVIRIYNSTGPDYFVKRIIGIPGDTIRIENGRVYLKKQDVNNFSEIDEVYLNEENKFSTYLKDSRGVKEFTVPIGHYFALGDNRNHSNDSRDWLAPIEEVHTPYVNYKNISGKVLVVLWPPQKIRFISSGVLK